MPTYNFPQIALRRHRDLLSNAKISDNNKAAYKRFYGLYDVSEARKCIVNDKLTHILELTHDIVNDMHHPEIMEPLFSKIQSKKNKVEYGMIVNVSKMFMRWLNDGETPKGLKNIKNANKKSQKRNLHRKDMWTWDDGLKAISATNSIQFKAIITTQLDGGLRPSEFIDLKYGDITQKGLFMIAEANGKTGKRSVILFRCVPYLQRWIQNHPTKNPDDPLWMTEVPEMSNDKRKNRKYNYHAMIKRIKYIAEKAGITKPADIYSLRHSSCFIDKMENIPDEIGAKKHGHSIMHYVETYARLSTDDDISRIMKATGIITEDEPVKDQPTECRLCGTINMPGVEMCEKCRNPLTLKKALELQKDSRTEIDEIKRKLDVILGISANKKTKDLMKSEVLRH